MNGYIDIRIHYRVSGRAKEFTNEDRDRLLVAVPIHLNPGVRPGIRITKAEETPGLVITGTIGEVAPKIKPEEDWT